VRAPLSDCHPLSLFNPLLTYYMFRREEEAELLSKLSESLSKGTAWDRIADLVDLQDSRSKTNTRATRDTGRFREVLLSLKREGETAPGAAGY
jgi:hypothetical protein